ncbi:MAG TPA: threonyl-tRNA synthetase editing domain-containing protein [Ktedonobacterales bacterium]|nr:threonyl-tRNA synthetase editing domain-containing protein [Ktedonobacterales bacterium]
MRLLMWHVDAFVAEPTERGRSPVADNEPQTIRIEEGLVVFAAAEQADESEPAAIAGRAAAAIVQTAHNLGTQTIVLHSFAHLFVDKLAAPAVARDILNQTQTLLIEQGYTASQSAFGWFNRLELHAKGHAFSRVARRV